MATKGGRRDSAGSQFFVTLKQNSFINGKHTVFGRVISGYTSVENLERTHRTDQYDRDIPIEGVLKDKILSAKVLRKRAHKYQPDRVKPKKESADANEAATEEESADDDGPSLNAPE